MLRTHQVSRRLDHKERAAGSKRPFSHPRGLKGKPTFPALRFLEKSQWWRPEDLRRLQVERLKALVETAKRETTFYGERLQDVKAGQVRSVEDLSSVPFLTRSDLQERGGDPEPPARRNHPNEHGGDRPDSPSRSTWTRSGWDGTEGRACEATDGSASSRGAGGCDLGLADRDHAAGPDTNLPRPAPGIPCCRPSRCRIRTMERYDGLIRAHRPGKIYGYASSIALQAEYVLSTGRPPYSGIRAVFATAEPLLPFQREAITRAFDCPVAVGTEPGTRG